jgi:protein-S-isoprenylcysteine O-methyltransferase Ste14
MYVGLVCALLGEAWLTESRSQLAYAGLVALAFHLRVILYEEPKLHQLFGSDFAAYRGRVRRWGVI